MPSKKRKYNARFPAGRIKKIMQTDEEVGKVAQAVPIIIYATPRTVELFVECLLSKALQVTVSRNAKTLSPSHVKQCILAESRFDFLKDLVKNIPDVSAAEEKEMQMSAESSPNSSRFSDTAPRRIVREDSNSSSSSDVRVQQPPRDQLPRDPHSRLSVDIDRPKVETITSARVFYDSAIDLTTKKEDKVVRIANFYQETLVDQAQHKSVITVNPTYNCPQPSTSSYATLTPVGPTRVDVPKPRVEMPKPLQTDVKPLFYIDTKHNNNVMTPPHTPRTPITPLINIDFSKSMKPEIKVLDSSVAKIVKEKKIQRQNSKSHKREPKPAPQINIDHINSGNLQIDEDYDT